METVHAQVSQPVDFNTILMKGKPPQVDLKPQIHAADLVVTIGQQATHTTLSTKPKAPVLATLIPEYSYETLLETLKKRSPQHINSSAIFITPPPSAYILLAKILLGEKQRIGILASEASIGDAKKIKKIAQTLGIGLWLETANPSDNLIQKLTQTLDNSDALLALPDPFIFNRKTAKNILLTTYRHRAPVIAFSASYVKAGAMAAVHSSPALIARQTGETIAGIIQSSDKTLPAPMHAKYILVSINENVARSLGVTYSSIGQVQQELHRQMRSAP
ncbi:MAG: hypothetical protein GXP17_11465 [Gammaproteobacteria bacterium]|nr:hypothetical protein [Gammaproteobacteria bacterium]